MHNFINQHVRDLAWVIGSTPLLNNTNDKRFLSEDFFTTEYNKFLPTLQKLDDNPQRLVEHIETGNTHLLGKYFESLIEFWLQSSADKELLTHNLQVFKGRNTIGEFDFVYRDLNSNKVYHLECAGKFYIAHKNIDAHSNFIGPNSIDNLERKVLKITNDQIKLCETNEGKEALFIEDIEEEVIPKVFLKGYIFYYADLFFNDAIVLPQNANINHPKGWWIFAKDIDYFFSGKNNKWIIMERSNWISKVNKPSESNLLSTDTLINKLKNYFKKNDYPLLIAEISHNEDGINQEISRGFVVSDFWPNIDL